MKIFAATSLLVLSANAAAVQKRQHGNMGGMLDLNSFSMPKGGIGSLLGLLSPQVQKAMKIEQIKPQVRNDAKRVRITYGPYKIRSSKDKNNPGNSISMDPHGSGYSFSVGDDFPRDVTVLESQSTLVNETFHEATIDDGLYNHHTTFFDMSKFPETWLACGNVPSMAIPVTVLMGGATGAGNVLYTTADGKHKSGFYVGKNEKLTIAVDVVNYNDRERQVYTVSELEYFPGKPDGYVHTQSHVLPLGMCDAGSGLGATRVRPPPGQHKFTLSGKNEITVAKDGYMVQTYGHLHDGGDNVIVTLNGKSICESKALYGGLGHEQVQENGEVWKTISSMSNCGQSVRVRKGDKLNFVANFDLEKHKSRHSVSGEEAEGMALVITSFAPLGPGDV